MSADEPVFLAVYELDLNVEFVGPMPERENRAAPEATPAERAIAEAVRGALREHGFTVTCLGRGSLRTGSTVADPGELRR